jgi:hypothetical protein
MEPDNPDLPEKHQQEPPLRLSDYVGNFRGVQEAVESLKLAPAHKAKVGILLAVAFGLGFLAICHAPWYSHFALVLLAGVMAVLTERGRENERRKEISTEPGTDASRQGTAGQSTESH